MLNRNTGAIILAAGESRRMNAPKALLPFDRNYSFLEKILDTYSRWGCGEIIVVTGNSMKDRLKELKSVPPSVSFTRNAHPEYERFYSVKLGLGSLKSSEYCFLQNVDNPFIEADILDILFENRSANAYVSPIFDGRGGHPVLLNMKNINFIKTYHPDSANLKEIMKLMNCRKIEMKDERVLININDRETYVKFFNRYQNGVDL